MSSYSKLKLPKQTIIAASYSVEKNLGKKCRMLPSVRFQYFYNV